jgi:hypothetical protein
VIEVRIPMSDLCEYSQQSSIDSYMCGKLLAAGVPVLQVGVLGDPEAVSFSREGILEHVGIDLKLNCIVWRWHEKDEFPFPGALN